LHHELRKKELSTKSRENHKKRGFAGDNLDNVDITSISGIHKTENNDKSKPSSMAEFLDSFSKKSTRRMYKRGIELFCEWYDKNVEAILRERKDDLTPRPNETLVEAKQRASRYEKLLEKFHAWLLEQGYKINSARTLCLGLMQLFRYYNMSITLRAGSPVSQTVVATSDFILQPEHVRSMFHVAKDLRSKLLVSMGNDLGWRISDILSIKRSELPKLEQEPPIEWVRITRKEKAVAKSCLSRATVALLKEYLFSFPTKNLYLFHSSTKNHISDETINARLRDLARDAGIELGNTRLHWHCFRKMIISQAKNLGVDPDIIKLMVGKSVKKDILTYMSGVDVRTAFSKLQEILGISAFTEESEDIVHTMETEIKELKQALVRVQQDANAYKKESEVLTERVSELEVRLREHGEVLDLVPTMQKQIAYLKGRITKKKRKSREKAEIII